MAERMNGNTANFGRRTQGSERRGGVPVPNQNYSLQLQQSRRDKERVIELIRERRELQKEFVEDLGLGNADLPAFAHKAGLVANIETHKAIAVGGATGSGKSTQLPQFLYEAGFDMTVELVPRRIIADGLGERIREELDGQIKDFHAEEVVGIIHGERVERHERNKILIMTPNTFLKMLPDFKKQFTGQKLGVIADEMHEANIFTEIAFGAAALAVQEEDNWRIAAASATHNLSTLEGPFQRLNNGFVPKEEIEGRPFTVEFRQEPELTPMQAYAQDEVKHDRSMIFTSGKKEIEYAIQETRRELEAEAPGSSRYVIFRELHAELTGRELSHVGDPVPEGYRLVIVSSPAGMSGITIEGVTGVYTDGTINRSELDNDYAEGLKRRILSQAGVIQQIGRAGRDVEGGVGTLCAPINVKKAKKNEADDGDSPKPRSKRSKQKADDDRIPAGMQFMYFDERDEHEPPEIYSTNLSRTALTVATAGYDFAELNNFIPHPVQQIDIINANEVLTRLGALDDDGAITSLGKSMDEYPISPELARGLVEAQQPGRTLQHMARAAFIAAAFSVGGIKDHKASEENVARRKQIIRHTSNDDLLAELDMMTKLYERTSEDWDGYGFIERHGLHPKRVERVRKVTKKILKSMDINIKHIEVTAPLPDEEQQLRDDFAAGFVDYVFEPIGKAPRSKKTQYRNIHGYENKNATIRSISDRSAMGMWDNHMVVGVPRWYEKGETKDGEPIKHDVIDHVIIVRPEVIGMHALKNDLVVAERKGTKMVGDRVKDIVQGRFGSLQVNSAEFKEVGQQPSEEAQELLVDYVVRRPGRNQRALRELASELASIRERTPVEVLEGLRKTGAPTDLTQEGVTTIIRRIAEEVSSAHELELKLSEYSFHANLTLARYYDVDSLQLIQSMSPQGMRIGNSQASIYYDEGAPYTTRLPKRLLSKITEPIYLDDGREVLYQREAEGGGKERVSFGSLD